MTLSADDVRFKIAAARRMLYRNGCDSGVGGHVSARASDDTFWISPFEYFDETVPTNLLRVSFDLEVVEGTWAASPAMRFHAEIYRRRADVNAVIHTHSHHALVFSTLGVPLGMFSSDAAVFHEEQTLFEETTEALVDGEALAACLGSNRLLVLQNHGVIIASQSLEEATVEAIMVESAARCHVDAARIGGHEYQEAPTRALKRGYRQHYVPQMWDANLRRLRRSDSDLFAYLGASPESAEHAP